MDSHVETKRPIPSLEFADIRKKLEHINKIVSDMQTERAAKMAGEQPSKDTYKDLKDEMLSFQMNNSRETKNLDITGWERVNGIQVYKDVETGEELREEIVYFQRREADGKMEFLAGEGGPIAIDRKVFDNLRFGLHEEQPIGEKVTVCPLFDTNGSVRGLVRVTEPRPV